MESGAIMIYLADEVRPLRREGREHWRVVEWLMWQMGGIGPMLGQAHHFLKYNPGVAPYAEARYGREAERLYGVLDRRLEGRDFVAGDGRGDYSIADMAIWPWLSRFEWQKIDLDRLPGGARLVPAHRRRARRCSAATTCRSRSAKSRCRRHSATPGSPHMLNRAS